MEKGELVDRIIELTNALAAEQDKNKIVAEQKAELVKLLIELQGKKPLHPSVNESTFYLKSEYDREYKKWMKIDKAIKQANK